MKGVFAGSFDPITLGHLDLIERSSKLFEYVYVILATNPKKNYMFTTNQKIEFCRSSCEHLNNVTCGILETDKGTLVDFCKFTNINVMVRGIRSGADLDYEMTLAQTNKVLNPSVETLFLPTKPEHAFISSSVVRELISFKKYDVLDKYVPKVVLDRLTQNNG